MNKFTFRLDFSVFHGTPDDQDSPVPYPRDDIAFEPADDTLILTCQNNNDGNCEYMTGSLGELSTSGWDDDRLEDYSVTLGK